MIELRGIVVSEGIVRGEAFVVKQGEIHVPATRVRAGAEDREVERFERALAAARREILELKASAREKLGEMTEIIGTHLAFLDDERGLLEPIREAIRSERWNAGYAVYRRFREVSERLSRMPEPLPSRVPDLKDVEKRLLDVLLGKRGTAGSENLPKRMIIIADDLTPTQTASLDKERVLAFATDRGGPASHTAILARHLGIPALVGLGTATRNVRTGQQVIVDAVHGRLVVDPSAEDVRRFASMNRMMVARSKRVQSIREPAHTKDGAHVTILGNVDSSEGGHELRELGVEGVGLFRTEFLFLGREDAPDEEDQVRHYRQILEDMNPLPVCLRTMDFGADKWDHRVGSGKEPNPFLGMRAIRLSFAHEPLFRAQLRAILRAATSGQARVMFPLINDLSEFRRAKALFLEVREELEKEGIPTQEGVPLGAMIETPAAALAARNLLKEVDFLSLGTNDLTQYTLAVDRTNPHVAPLFAPHHPSVLRLIQETAQAARDAGKPLSACGEMAGTPRYTPVLLGLGVTKLSMAARLVPEVVAEVRRLRLPACRRLAEDMIGAEDADEASRILDEFGRRPARRR